MAHLSRRSLLAALGAGPLLFANSLKDAQLLVVRFDNSGKSEGLVKVDKYVLTDSEWKQKLSPKQFDVTRRAGTETPFTGPYWNNHQHGLYRCVCCNNALFSSDTKFESFTGWPSFGNRSRRRILKLRMTIATVSASKSSAIAAMRILVMYSTMVRNQPACVIA